MNDYFILAIKNLRRRGIRSWLTLIGIFIGIAAVVSLIMLGNGLRDTAAAQFGVSSTEVITIQAGGLSAHGPPGMGVTNKLTDEDTEAIDGLSVIDIAVSRHLPTGKLEYNDNVVFNIVISIPDGEKREFVYEEMDLEEELGRLLEDGDDNNVVLGYNFFADKVGLEKKIIPGKTLLLQDKEFRVVGIAKKKGSFLMDNVIYMKENALKDLFEIDDEVDIIAAKIKSKSSMNKAKEDIEDLMRKRRGVKKGEENFEVSTPQSSLDTVNQVLFGVQLFIILIAAISIAVGSIGIVNTMTTSVLERKREIGIMKAIGAKNSDIFYQFFFEAGLMGLMGGIVGIAFGILLGFIGTNALNSFIGGTTKPKIDLFLIGFSLLGSFLIGSISGVIPALNAAKQRPVEALRS